MAAAAATRRDLHNVYYANLGQRACINKCYIIIQIKCFNLHTFYRPPAGMRNATPARDTRSTRGTVDTRPSFGSFKCPSSERNSFRGGSSDGHLERAFLRKIDENCFLHVYTYIYYPSLAKLLYNNCRDAAIKLYIRAIYISRAKLLLFPLTSF